MQPTGESHSFTIIVVITMHFNIEKSQFYSGYFFCSIHENVLVAIAHTLMPLTGAKSSSALDAARRPSTTGYPECLSILKTETAD